MINTCVCYLGQMLLNWLQSTIDDKHYLRLVMTRHDMNVVLTQFCTCLIAAGVMKEKEGRNEQIFKVRFSFLQILATIIFFISATKFLFIWFSVLIEGGSLLLTLKMKYAQREHSVN